MTIRFEFDADKSAANLQKHGIDFVEAQRLWDDELASGGPTASPGEERWMRVAGLDGTLWSAIYTMRNGGIRLISVRRARSKEASQYDGKADLR